MIRLLKLSDRYETLSSDEILFIHLGQYQTNGKVSYSTDAAVSVKPKYVLLVLGNVDNICYLCHIADYDYDPDSFRASRHLPDKFRQYSPDRYKEEHHKTWFIFDSMQKVPVDFIEQLLSDHSDTSVADFIKTRANNKKL